MIHMYLERKTLETSDITGILHKNTPAFVKCSSEQEHIESVQEWYDVDPLRICFNLLLMSISILYT